MKTIETNSLILRKFEIEDAEKAYENWAGVEELANISDYRVNLDVEETKMIIQMGLGEEDEDECTWAIALKESNEPIGFIRLYEISIKDKKCKITWTISKKCWNKGIELEALNKIIEYLFCEKEYEIIICEYYSYKENICKIILENIGMKKEAKLRARKVDENTGETYSKIIYSIIKDEYKNKN